MRRPDYAEFLADVRERGVRVPLEILGDGTILDGRSRYWAAKELGLKSIPTMLADLRGDDELIYMLRAASKRRHLTDDQRAMLADDEREYLAAKAKKERAKAGRAAGGDATEEQRKNRLETTSTSKRSRGSQTSRSRESSAKHHNVSERKVRQAQIVKRADPSLAEQVKAGDMKLPIALRHVQRRQKLQTLQEKADAACLSADTAAASGTVAWKIIHGDCVQGMVEMSSNSARLIFADPPYNIGVDYGEGKRADRLTDEEYLAWCRQWMAASARLLTDDGSLWVIINDEYADHFGLLLREIGLCRRSWIKWYETFGVNCKNNFNRCSRHIFYCVKDSKRFVFNADAVSRPSDRLTKYHDRRADPAGKIWDDVWQVPRLVGTAKERIPDFPTQIPLEITRAIVGCSSEPGDIVIDPFSGSGSTGVACIELGRRYVGFELEKNFADLSVLRLTGVISCGHTA